MDDDLAIMAGHIGRIKDAALEIGRDVTLMEICGGHTNVIMKHGIRDIMPKNIRLISGPGCPVCVSSQYDIDCTVELARRGVPVATYGDMLRVPGSRYSLEDARSTGGRVFEVYSAAEVLAIKKKYSRVVFFGIGFETTAPMSAYLLSKGVCVYSVHKLVPPAMKALLKGEVKLDGFIDPGHVSTITGVRPYREIEVAQVITGFTPERILRGISVLCGLVRDGKRVVVNGYPEAVREDGNVLAQRMIDEQFHVCDSEWRGLGAIPRSGLEVRDDALNAKVKYKDVIDSVPVPGKTGCRCGDVLTGVIEPTDCALYARSCVPGNPKGACMVSDEGSCAIYFRNGVPGEGV
ncbi:MAG: hydrogenase formation protein HypD [archaeon]